ncbi:FAD:protein FMN transferase [Tenacibaculum sp. IB213877]|uniref:FAD:protein FMN transferase n=1 Tax=Tenacibaculum sp. IB213877 TaxID=3097351 RepID=UPI002A5A3075|nr:FAD:protein FMN transferase [Tenacibaculum sp. IB213877]MDY0780916.1 FAD:protein FMN transferase [Tenacibaculum sp. IB213877]
MKNTVVCQLLMLFFLLNACKKAEEKALTKLQGNVFGTSYHIIYDSEINYQKGIDSVFHLVNKSFSTYLPTSDISKINQNDTTVVVNHLFKEVFEKSKRIYKETEGYFDITVGQLVNAYGFGSKQEMKDFSEEELNQMMQKIGFDKVQLVNNKIVKQHPAVELDANSIAKGYGIDVVGRLLEEKGIQNYLVEIGGEIRTRGLKNGNKWKVAIEKPNFDGTQSFQKLIEVSDISMATSGNYRKFKVADGKKYVHILNPLTGVAQESNLLSATVLGSIDCADVDAYATAFMAMGFEKTKVFLTKHPELKVILLHADAQGNIVEFEN